MMATVSITEAKNRFNALARGVEAGEQVVITRHGKPVVELVQHRPKGGIDLDAREEFLRREGVTQLHTHIAEHFDEPLPEDFLLKPLP